MSNISDLVLDSFNKELTNVLSQSQEIFVTKGDIWFEGFLAGFVMGFATKTFGKCDPFAVITLYNFALEKRQE